MIDRSEIMRAVRSKDTKPEMIVRRLVHGLGYRYRLHRPLHACAGELAVATDAEPHRRLAVTRLLEYYLDSASRAVDLLFPAHRQHRPELATAHPSRPRRCA